MYKTYNYVQKMIKNCVADEKTLIVVIRSLGIVVVAWG